MFGEKRRIGNDGHNMNMSDFILYLNKLMGEGGLDGGLGKASDSYEVDKEVERILMGSGRTKKQCSTRRSFDNAAAERALHSVVKKIAWDLNHGECKTLTGKVKEQAIREYMDRELIKSNKKVV